MLVRLEFGVNLLGPLQSEKGVGEGCRATLRALEAAGIPCTLNNWVDPTSVNREGVRQLFGLDNPYPVNLIHLNADALPLLARQLPHYRTGRVNVGYWNWELDVFPEDWQESFALCDEVWYLPLRRAAIAGRSPVPVHHVPYALNSPGRGRSLRPRRFGLPEDRFLFLSVFDFQSHLARKNPLAVIRAFRQAFGRRRDVLLVLKMAHARPAAMDYAEVVLACGGQANIRLLDQMFSRDEVDAVLGACDAYVSLHRSEGYGLVMAEAMARGKPVLATGYSGNLDFMTGQNSLLVGHRLIELEADHGPYRRGRCGPNLTSTRPPSTCVGWWSGPVLERASGHRPAGTSSAISTRKKSAA